MKRDKSEYTARNERDRVSSIKNASRSLLPQYCSENSREQSPKKVFSITRLDGSCVLTIEKLSTMTDEHGVVEQQVTYLQGAFKHPGDIYITAVDKERIEKVVSDAEPSLNLAMLEEELARATVVSSEHISPDVVTMNSQVRFKDLSSQGEFEVILSYPSESGPRAGRVSVLAPVGTALLGLRVGDEIEWPLPSGRRRFLKVSAVPFQPEAAGQYHL